MTPAATPPAEPSTVEITVSCRDRVIPFVVSVLPAHRRLAVLCSSAMATQPSAVDSSSARSTISCGVVAGVVTVPPPGPC
jgi:hypothetical protein